MSSPPRVFFFVSMIWQGVVVHPPPFRVNFTRSVGRHVLLGAFFVPSPLRDLFKGSSAALEDRALPYGTGLDSRHGDDAPDTGVVLHRETMQGLSDTELARLGLSHGVLALRAGGTERALDTVPMDAG